MGVLRRPKQVQLNGACSAMNNRKIYRRIIIKLSGDVNNRKRVREAYDMKLGGQHQHAGSNHSIPFGARPHTTIPYRFTTTVTNLAIQRLTDGMVYCRTLTLWSERMAGALVRLSAANRRWRGDSTSTSTKTLNKEESDRKQFWTKEIPNFGTL